MIGEADSDICGHVWLTWGEKNAQAQNSYDSSPYIRDGFQRHEIATCRQHQVCRSDNSMCAGFSSTVVFCRNHYSAQIQDIVEPLHVHNEISESNLNEVKCETVDSADSLINELERLQKTADIQKLALEYALDAQRVEVQNKKKKKKKYFNLWGGVKHNFCKMCAFSTRNSLLIRMPNHHFINEKKKKS